MIAPNPSALGRPYGSSYDTGTSTVITAEIPAVPAGPNYGVLLPDGTIWYPGSQKRLPAPLPLRIVVWALAFLVLIAAAGDFIVRTHPGWMDPLRRMVKTTGGAPRVSTGQGNHATTPPPTVPAVSAAIANPQPARVPAFTTAYTVNGTSTYQIVVKSSAVAFVSAYSLVNGLDTGSALFVGNLQPGATQTISATGPVDLAIDAGGTSVTLTSGGKQIGTVVPPPSVPWHFWFEPAAPKL